MTGEPFSKLFYHIKLVKSFSGTSQYETGVHDIESIWQCSISGNTYAYYKTSGLRAITTELYIKMLNLKD